MQKEFNLISQAENYNELAHYCYNKIKVDNINEDLNVRNTCLFLQMCIELYIKGFVEILCGCDYKHTHELIDNINIIRNNKENIREYDILEKVLNDIEDNAVRIKEFHTAAVYIDGFVSTIREMSKCFEIISKLKEYWNSIEPSEELTTIKEMNELSRR